VSYKPDSRRLSVTKAIELRAMRWWLTLECGHGVFVTSHVTPRYATCRECLE
jgi:hypothetical protein